MIPSLLVYLPRSQDLDGLAIVGFVGMVFSLAGGAMLGRRASPELRLVAGWGGFCLLLTLWGSCTRTSLRWPVSAFILASILGLLWRDTRPARRDLVDWGKIILLTLPLWLVLAPLHPSQPDTFLNLLPNAAYLVAHDYLPADARPDAHSFIAGAPYNTQFAAYLGGLLDPDFPASGMSLFNVLLQLCAALALARCLTAANPPSPTISDPEALEPDSKPLSWGAIAGGFVLAIPLNPGFVPRIHFAPYGEPALAVTALFAAVLWLDPPWKKRWLALGLVLAAMINTKQSGIGLVAALAAGSVMLSLVTASIRPGDVAAHTASRRLRREALFLASGLVPALVLYLVWRVYVTRHFAIGELKPLPFHAWQWGNIPAILGSILHVIVTKPFYFLPCLGMSLFGIAGMVGRQPGRASAAAFLFAATFFAYTAFLILTYIAHFPGVMSTEAHSYFRYNTHLSLLLMAAFIAALAPWIRAKLSHRAIGALGWLALLTTLLVPLAFASRLRFDLDQPQPIVWDMTKELASLLTPADHLALLLPGDNGSVAAMMESLLRDTAPFRRDLDLVIKPMADRASLMDAARTGHMLAFISCSDGMIREKSADVPVLPSRSAVLLRYGDGRWQLIAAWPYQDIASGSDEEDESWQHILSWEPLCRAHR